MIIDWQSAKSHLLLNPRLTPLETERLHKLAASAGQLADHVLISTSGSTASGVDDLKLVALSKNALLANAQSVNAHLGSSSSDIWVHVLPDFHVGGIGIWARSHLSGAKVIRPFPEGAKWDANVFCSAAQETKGTLSALVPAQFYDVVRLGLRAPRSIRAIVIGGDRLGVDIYEKGRALGWNPLPSYGMSETSSQVATASLESSVEDGFPRMKLLNGAEVEIDADSGCLKIRGAMLFTGYYLTREGNPTFVDPKQNGWFVTADRGVIDSGFLTAIGRRHDIIKIGGEIVNLERLDGILEVAKIKLDYTEDVALVAMPDERLGHVIEIACAVLPDTRLDNLVSLFNERVLPFEKIRKVHSNVTISRTELGKLNRAALTHSLQS